MICPLLEFGYEKTTLSNLPTLYIINTDQYPKFNNGESWWGRIIPIAAADTAAVCRCRRSHDCHMYWRYGTPGVRMSAAAPLHHPHYGYGCCSRWSSCVKSGCSQLVLSHRTVFIKILHFEEYCMFYYNKKLSEEVYHVHRDLPGVLQCLYTETIIVLL